MLKTIHCTVNGKAHTLDVDIRASLLEALRAAGFTGAKQSCGVGECGACTVLIDDQPVNSCLYLAVRAEGKHIRTVEGECQNALSPIQNALLEAGAVQCGFCTPGIVMSATAVIEQSTSPLSPTQIRHSMAGNLCRCTGYEPIVRAIQNCQELGSHAPQGPCQGE